LKHFIINTNFHLKYFLKIVEVENLKCSEIQLIIINIRDNKLEDKVKLLDQKYTVVYVPFIKSKFYGLYKLLLNLSILRNSSEVFLANPRSLLTRILFILFPNNGKITSFDDGSANLLNNGYFQKKENILSRLIGFLLKRIDYENIYKRITNHYTFFKSKVYFPPNADINRINLTYFKSGSENNSFRHILLLPSYYEDGEWLTNDQEILFIKESIKKFDIHEILPHPSNSLERLKKNNLNVKNISSDSLDYISESLANSNLRIYGFRTTTLILLSQLNLSPNLQCYNIQVGELDGKQLMTFPEKDIWSNFEETIILNLKSKIE
tara:strand:- start:19301 stop:20269 length:969 start_codon:yes stop_codon:yes gene_type:complete